jgi:type IV secretory pathway VirB10-like protein
MKRSFTAGTLLLLGAALVSGCQRSEAPAPAPQAAPPATAAPAEAAPATTAAAPPAATAPAAPAATTAPAPAAPAAAPAKPAAAAAPARPAPTATPRPPQVIAEGTELLLALETPLASNKSREGDDVEARLVEPVTQGEHTLLPADTRVRGVVTAAVDAGRVKGRARLALRFDTVVVDGREVPLRASGLDITAESSSGRDKKVVAGAAAAGGIIGAIADGKKGAAIGVLAGGAAGGAAVLATKGDQVVLEAGQKIKVTLEKDLRLH